MDKVKIIDLKPYFTQPSLYPSQSRKFWTENQAAILDFIASLEGMDSFFNIHTFAVKVDNYLCNPHVCDARESYLILGKPLDISAHDYGDAELQKLVTDEVLAAVDRQALFVVVNVPRADARTQGRYYREHQREQSDPWGHVTNDMLVHLLSHFSLTQIHPFQPHGQRVQVPSGLELVQLIQSRLMPPDYRGDQPFAAFNQYFDPRFSGGYRPYPRWCNGGNSIFNNMNSMFNQFNIPQVSNGDYARHAFTGAWVWYPRTPLFQVIPVDRKSENPREALSKVLNIIAENMRPYCRDGEGHIRRMLNEIDVTFMSNPDGRELLDNDYITLFVGEGVHIPVAVSDKTTKDFTNWAIVAGDWSPQNAKNPDKVVNTIEGIAKYIAGYMDYPYQVQPHMF